MDQVKKKKINEAIKHGLPLPPPKKKTECTSSQEAQQNNVVKETQQNPESTEETDKKRPINHRIQADEHDPKNI